MKKILLVLLSLLSLTCFLSACNEKENDACYHAYSEWAIVDEATCLKDGLKSHTCSKCGDIETQIVEALGHTEVIDARVEPTCTFTGLTEGKHCSSCNTVLINQEVIDKLGHSEVIHEAKTPTCSEIGWDEYITCQREGCNYSTYHELSTTGVHIWGEWLTVKQATCKDEGQLIRVCSKCSTSEQTTVAKAETHTEVIDVAISATCTVDGKTEGKHCSVCGITLVEQTTIKAKGHTEVIDEAISPTCTAEGKTEGKHCSICNKVIIAQTSIGTVDHTFNNGACAVCKCMDVDSKNAEIIAENQRHEQSLKEIEESHEYWISYAQKEISSIKSEYGISYVYDIDYCYDCLADIEEEIGHLEKCIEALSGDNSSSAAAQRQRYRVQIAEKEEEKDVYYAHIDINDWQDEIELEQLAFADDISGENRLHKENLDAINAKYECAVNGHTVVVDEAVAPTCIATGKTEGSHCSNCGFVVIEQTTLESLGHKEVVDEAVKETCTTDGKTEGSHCSVCGDVIVAQKIVSMHHIEVIDAAAKETCTTSGLTEGKHCSVCGEVLIPQEVIAATGHSIVIDEAVEPTCIISGLTEGNHCSVCDEVLIPQEVIAATGHTVVIDEAVEPTCTSSGLTEGKHCSKCGEVLISQEKVAAKGHNYVDYVCDECNYHYYTKGLNFTLSNDSRSYSISGYAGSDADVIIPAIYNHKTVTSIDKWAFDGCNSLTSIIIPDSITSIGKFAFYGCSSLTNLIIPDSIINIDNYAFEYCSSLTSVIISNNITSIGNSVFYNCSSLTSITIPNSVISIGDYAFSRHRDTMKNQIILKKSLQLVA